MNGYALLAFGIAWHRGRGRKEKPNREGTTGVQFHLACPPGLARRRARLLAARSSCSHRKFDMCLALAASQGRVLIRRGGRHT